MDYINPNSCNQNAQLRQQGNNQRQNQNIMQQNNSFQVQQPNQYQIQNPLLNSQQSRDQDQYNLVRQPSNQMNPQYPHQIINLGQQGNEQQNNVQFYQNNYLSQEPFQLQNQAIQNHQNMNNNQQHLRQQQNDMGNQQNQNNANLYLRDQQYFNFNQFPQQQQPQNLINQQSDLSDQYSQIPSQLNLQNCDMQQQYQQNYQMGQFNQNQPFIGQQNLNQQILQVQQQFDMKFSSDQGVNKQRQSNLSLEFSIPSKLDTHNSQQNNQTWNEDSKFPLNNQIQNLKQNQIPQVNNQINNNNINNINEIPNKPLNIFKITPQGQQNSSQNNNQINNVQQEFQNQQQNSNQINQFNNNNNQNNYDLGQNQISFQENNKNGGYFFNQPNLLDQQNRYFQQFYQQQNQKINPIYNNQQQQQYIQQPQAQAQVDQGIQQQQEQYQNDIRRNIQPNRYQPSLPQVNVYQGIQQQQNQNHIQGNLQVNQQYQQQNLFQDLQMQQNHIAQNHQQNFQIQNNYNENGQFINYIQNNLDQKNNPIQNVKPYLKETSQEQPKNYQNKALSDIYHMQQKINEYIDPRELENSRIQAKKNFLRFPFVDQQDQEDVNRCVLKIIEIRKKAQNDHSTSKREQMPEVLQQQELYKIQKQQMAQGQQNVENKQMIFNQGNKNSQEQQKQKINPMNDKKKEKRMPQPQQQEKQEEDLFDLIQGFEIDLKVEYIEQFQDWKSIKIKSQTKFQQIVQIIDEISKYTNQEKILQQILSSDFMSLALKEFHRKQVKYENLTIKCFLILVYILNKLFKNYDFNITVVQVLASNIENIQNQSQNYQSEIQQSLEILNSIYLEIQQKQQSLNPNQQLQKSQNQYQKAPQPIKPQKNYEGVDQDLLNILYQQNKNNIYDNNSNNNRNMNMQQCNYNINNNENNNKNYINNNKIINSNEKKAICDDFVKTKVIPTLKEIKEDRKQDFQKYLIEMPKNGKFNSLKEYLSVNYYLMREDFLLEPRSLLKNVLSDNKIKYNLFNQEFRSQLYVYCNVRVVNIKFSIDNFFVELKAQPLFMEQRSCSFSNSKRLLHGSLVIICDENINKQFLGLVSYLDDSIDQAYQTRQTVKFGVKIINIQKQSQKDQFNEIIEFLRLSQKKSYFVFEPRNFWLSSYHCLKEIRKMSKDAHLEIPFQNVIVGDQIQLQKPQFINQSTTYQFQTQNRSIKFNLNQEWPSQLKGTLDESQFKALQSMLTKSISLIQGPPGTGKTFIGITGVKILLQNWEVWNHTNTPILIICKTNHALDQFLSQILKFENRIVRIGTRIQVPELKDYLIGKYKPKINQNLKYASKKMNKQIELIVKPLDQIHKVKDFLNHYKSKKFNFDILNYVCEEFLSMIQIQVELSDKEKHLIFDRWWRNRFDDTLISDLSKQNLYFRRQVTSEKKELLNQFFNDRFEAEKKYYEQRRLQKRLKKLQAEVLEKSVNFIQQEQNQEDNEMNEELLDHLEFKQIVDSLEYEDYELNQQLLQDFLHNKQEQGLYMDFAVFMAIKIFGYKKQQKKSLDGLIKNFGDFNQKSKQYKQERKKFYLDILKNKRIAGMTLTGSQMNMDTLRELNYQIIILEEAGQILETHLVPLLKPGLQQIIMIGDHQQLKPSVQNYQSMLERLINKGVEYVELNVQRRMKKEFSSLIRLFYPKLQDHPSVLFDEQVQGMQKNFLFLDHRGEENVIKNRASMSNELEAKLVTNLVKYILDQKQFNQKQITVLSMYQGQCRLLRHMLSQKLLSQVEVSTVDNYQGEENEIIILSLVRSNKENDIGFLKNSNRINVGFSRAKVGFYVLGNIQMLSQQEIEFWKNILKYCQNNQFIANEIQSFCLEHKSKISVSLEDNSFQQKSPNGGCQQICNKMRQCRHKCLQQCHKGSCEQQICNQPCDKLLPCHHKCQKKCSEKCGGYCNVQVEKVLKSCGHKTKLSCGEDENKFQCQVMVPKQFDCSHIAKVECYKLKSKLYCNEKVLVQSSCGNQYHKFEIICGLRNIYREKRICNFLVSKNCDTCGYGAKVECSRQNDFKCSYKIQKKLMCGHQILVNCSEQKTILDQPCEQNCQKLLDCGHKCKNLCSKKCLKCNQQYQQQSICCNEQMIVSCSYQQATRMQEIKKFPCVCNTNICRRHFKKQKENFSSECEEICGEVLPCSHTCKSKCKDCLYGLLHQNCDEKIEKTLSCGHKAIISCSQSVLYHNCNQVVDFMTCQNNNPSNLKCYQKNKIKESLMKFVDCQKCQHESVLTLNCNHDINFPIQYFNYQYSRKPFTIPACRQPNCGKQLMHHAFANQIKEAFENIRNIELQIDLEFDKILLKFEEQTKKVAIDNPYGAIENEQRYYLSQEKQEQIQSEQSQINKLRICVLKQIISNFEKVQLYVESMWFKNANKDKRIDIMCQAFKNIENLYFQHLDKCRFQFYLELHEKIIYYATVILIFFQNKENQYKNLAGFPFGLSKEEQRKIYQDNNLISKNLNSFCLNEILSLEKIQMKKCKNDHIAHTDNLYCDKCYQILENYEIQFDI